MKVDPRQAANHRTLQEVGLPPWYQPGGYDRAWLAAITLPETARLRSAFAGAADPLHTLGTLAPDEVPLQIDTEGRWPEEVQFLNWRWVQASDAGLAAALGNALVVAFKDRGVTPEALSSQVRLTTLVLHPVPHATTPYVGAVFVCDWDEEHGAGVLLHGTTVLATGDADTGMDLQRALAHRAAMLTGRG